MEKWFGLKLNFKWPHEGFCVGFSIDHFDADEGMPWESIVIRVLFLTLVYDFGWGNDSKEMYNNQ